MQNRRKGHSVDRCVVVDRISLKRSLIRVEDRNRNPHVYSQSEPNTILTGRVLAVAGIVRAVRQPIESKSDTSVGHLYNYRGSNSIAFANRFLNDNKNTIIIEYGQQYE